jgi:hypothetical protein
MSKRALIESLWRTLLTSQFDIDELSQGIIEDCGVDAGNLTSNDIKRLLTDGVNVNWTDIAFAFDEVLAYYSVADLTDREFVRAVTVSLYSSDAIQNGHGDWEFTFDKIFTLMCRNMQRVTFAFRMEFFAELLKPSCQEK